MNKLRLASCLFVITFANFSLVTPGAAQEKPQPKLSQLAQPCELHEFARGCTTDGKPGLQAQVCENGRWTDVGTCVSLQEKTGLQLPPPRQCKPGATMYCVKNGKVGGVAHCSSNGYWVFTECLVLQQQPPK